MSRWINMPMSFCGDLKQPEPNPLRRGDVVMVQFDLPGLKLAELLHGKLLEMGVHPVMRLSKTTVMEHDFYEKSDEDQLVFHGSWDEELFRNLNGRIFLHGPTSLTHLADIDPKRIGKVAVAMKPLRDIMREREEQGMLGWTLCAVPTDELAHHAGISLEEYTGQIIKACYLDQPDPVKAWENIFHEAMGIKTWMNEMDVQYYHVESENIDLKITPGDQRKWIGISGHNIPSFELFISPDWRGTEGDVFCQPAILQKRKLCGGSPPHIQRWRGNGNQGQKGESFTKKQLEMDEGARRVG